METSISSIAIPFPRREAIVDDGILYFANLEEVSVPTFALRREADRLTVEVDEIPESVSQVGSSIVDKTINIEIGHIATFVHDFTFAPLSEVTDQALCKHFPVMHDGEDNLTPDYIIDVSATERRVFEFGTTRGYGRVSVMNYYNTKREKYLRPLSTRKDRTGWLVTLSCIVVGHNHIVSDLDLADAVVDELVYRFRFANAVAARVLTAYPLLASQVSEDVTQAERRGQDAIFLLSRSIENELRSSLNKYPLADLKHLDKFLEKDEDKDYMRDMVQGAFQDALKEFHTEHYVDGTSREKALCQNYEDALKVTEGVRDALSDRHKSFKRPVPTDQYKSTIKIPGWLAKAEPRDISIHLTSQHLTGMSDETITSRTWKAVMNTAYCSPQNSWQEDIDREISIATSTLEEQEESENTKAQFHRVKADLSKDDWILLAMRGIEGKANRSEDMVREVRDQSHAVLSPYHDTSGIEACLEENSWFKAASGLDSHYLFGALDQLLDAAMDTAVKGAPVGDKMLKVFRNLRETRLCHWACMVSQLATELAISAKQGCKRHCFILKKLPNFPVYVLIKTTRSGSHIFYSLAVDASKVRKDLTGDIFKNYERSGMWFLTEFNSVKLCKLENMIKLPMMVVALISYFREADSQLMTKTSTVSCLSKRMTSLAVMVMLEDKATTEELITIQRYIQMEGFVAEPLLPKPQKMAEKLDVQLRTTLQVFLLKQCLLSIGSIARQPFKRQSLGKEVSWKGCFAGCIQQLCSTEMMVNSWYLGYLKNKDEDTEANMLASMYEKIVKIEEERPEKDDYLLGGDPLTPGTHEFSGTFIKFMAKALNDEIRHKKGDDWKAEVVEQFYRAIGSTTLDQLATLKATSQFDKEWEEFEDVRLKTYHRSKVLERMAQIVKDGCTFYTDTLGRSFKVVLRDGCMRVCLFKKAQHGGLREIYVLRLEERLIQFGIETLARKVNELTGHETISIPSRKEEILDTHHVRAAKYCGEGTLITMCSSNDAKTWNQGHYTTKFAFLMCELLPTELHTFIWASCAIFRRKRMMLNLDYLRSVAKTKCPKEGFKKKLHDGFSGNADVRWMKKGKTYIETETGMMQGILHLVSSLFHAAFQCAIKKLFRTQIKRIYPNPVLIDILEGSDDSAILISTTVRSAADERRFRILCSVMFYWVKYLSVYAGIYVSPKSTMGCLDVCEYNSEFRFARLMCRPTLKWVAASLSIPEVEKLSDRQEAFSNLLTSVLEGGGTSGLCSQVQLCQAWCHYVLLGLWSSCVFSFVSPFVTRFQNPDIGFFLLDNPVSAGILGFRHNLWRTVRTTELSRIFRKILHNATAEGFSLTSGGSLSKCHMIRWGNRQKLLRIKEKTGLDIEWREITNDDPSILYKNPETNDEVKLVMAAKLDSPGISESLSKGNVLGRVLASSVYILQRRCVTVRNAKRKYTLAELILECKDLGTALTFQEENALFGDVIALEKNEEICQKYSQGLGQAIAQSREMRRAKVEVLSHESCFRSAPVRIMGDVFFGTTRSFLGPGMLERELNSLRETFAWIDPDPSVCLKKSPFDSHMEMKTFFEKLEQKDRKVRLIGAAVYTRMGQTSLDNLIRLNFQKEFELSPSAVEEAAEVQAEEAYCKHVITMILTSPFTNERKRELIVDFLRYCTMEEPKTLRRRSRTNVLRVMKKWLVQQPRIDELIETSRDGICGTFTLRQKVVRSASGQVRYKGDGVWSGKIEGTDCKIYIRSTTANTQVLREVVVSHESDLPDFLAGLSRLCKELHISNPRVSLEDIHTEGHSGPLLGYLVGFRLESRLSKAGAPLYVVPETKGYLRELLNRTDVELVVRGDILNVTAVSDVGSYTMLSYRASGRDVSPEMGNLFQERTKVMKSTLDWVVREPAYSWIGLRPVSAKFRPALDQELSGEVTTPTIDRQELKDVIARCCKSSLRRKGLTVGQFSEVRLRQEDHVDFDASDLAELLEEEVSFDTKTVKELITIAEENVMDMEVIFGREDVEIFDPSESISRLDPLSHHRFCDRIIDDLIDDLGQGTVKRAIHRREMREKDRKGMTTLFNYIGHEIANMFVIADEDEDEEVVPDQAWG
uniref:RNA-directed RNA polymerase L n=1 Tax=Dali Phenu tick virus 1 TaxID=2972304 RepID=A0A9E8AA66_9VIRU|nr:MAG: RNA-dependent RNA polymerase [Dali Phenu tick virus 1]